MTISLRPELEADEEDLPPEPTDDADETDEIDEALEAQAQQYQEGITALCESLYRRLTDLRMGMIVILVLLGIILVLLTWHITAPP